MAEHFPHTIPIEIDRAGYYRYLRIASVIRWTFVCTLIGASVGAVVFMNGEPAGEVMSHADIRSLLLGGFGGGAVGGLLVGGLGYVVCGRTLAKRTAIALEVTIEGPFLRIAEGVWTRCDRRLHFKTIDDYTCCQGPLMRWCGISLISLRRDLIANGRALPGICIPAAKDPIRTRDLLSEIDRIREGEQDA